MTDIIDVRDIPTGWQRLVDRIHGDLDALGVDNCKLEFTGVLPEVRVKVRQWIDLDVSKLRKIERTEHDFFELSERTCERCGRPGERVKIEGRRDRILCVPHIAEEPCG